MDWAMPYGIPAVIMLAHDDHGNVIAVRLVGDTNAFTDDAQFPAVGLLELVDGRLYVGPPEANPDQTDVIEVTPGTWVVQLSDEPCGAQLYRIGESTRTRLAGLPRLR